MQQIFLGLGAVAKKTYLDDVFSTFVYKGTGGANTVNTGLDISGEGGLVWVKNRTNARNSMVFDTVRGVNQEIATQSASAQNNNTALNQTFTSTGFTFNTSNSDVNSSSHDYASWSFRKAPGFFTIKQYTGTGSSQAISHDLGSMPGLIIVKLTSSSGGDWAVWQRDLGTEPELGQQKYVMLNRTNAAYGDGAKFSAAPTATTFSVGTSNDVNGNGNTYIAYLFGGGESDAATARSVDFDGSGDYLSLATSSDFAFGTGDFTIEFWHKCDGFSNYPHQLDFRVDGSDTGTTNSLVIYMDNSGITHFWLNGSIRISANKTVQLSQWQHVALVRNSSTTTLYLDGIPQGTYSDSTNYGSSSSNSNPLVIGQRQGSYASNSWDGRISNLRIVKGTAVYTSGFRPPYEPLTNITNTKFLGCNSSSTTGSTVTPGTITANGDPTASTDSPFDDPSGYVFGDAGDQNVIKCGSYVGNGSATHRKIELGFEPQWIMTKRADGGTGNWDIADMMRGTPADDGDSSQNGSFLWANQNWAEATDRPFTTHSTGFGLKNTSSGTNGDGDTYIYMAIRRPDGYCGKQYGAGEGTSVFAMDTGNGSSTIPCFDSGFPVDFGLARKVASTWSWQTGARLIGGNMLNTNSTNAEGQPSGWTWDSNAGWLSDSSFDSDFQSWMWKRHAGFDVVCYEGNGTSGTARNHSLNKTPEMIWIKRRDTSGNAGDWMVGHKGLNGGSSPWNEYLVLNKEQGEMSDNNPFNNVAPTTTAFQLSDWDRVNANNSTYIAMLFSSVNGISKVGSFSGSSSDVTLDLGFVPRFFMVKGRSGPQDTRWVVWDSVRGITGGGADTPRIYLNDAGGSSPGANDNVATTSSGITITTGPYYNNASGYEYIYYAHA